MKVIEDNLYIGGGFTEINGKKVNKICYYDGNKFYQIGGGVGGNGYVNEFEYDGQNIYICGSFEFVSQVHAKNIARWGLPIGIKKNSDQFSQVKVFPNPSTGMVSIQGLDNIPESISAIDIQGKELPIEILNASDNDLKIKLQSGFNILVIQMESGIVRRKVLIQ